MDSHLYIQGREYRLVRVQRGGASFVYQGENEYLRIGDPRIIKKHLVAHTLMEKAGFPVPRLLATGINEGQSYFTETSMGETRLGDAFTQDWRRDGTISNAHFKELVGIVSRYAEAQLKAPRPPGSLRGFKPAIHIRTLSRELPAYATRIEARFSEIAERLSAFPTVLSHGDFNPQNLFARGIIDLEHALQGPWGYDVVTSLVHINQFPDSSEYEYFARYRFSDEQRAEYLAVFDALAAENQLPKLSDYLKDFEFCRAVWSSVRMSEWPKLQKWRHELLVTQFLD